MTDGRQTLRCRVFLRAVLQLCQVVAAERPALIRSLAKVSATAQLQVAGTELGAALCWRNGSLFVDQGVHPRAEVRCTFADVDSLNSFFAGKLALPRISGLRHPRLLLGTARMLSALRILQPQKKTPPLAEQALRVRLLLYLVSQALAELYRGGHPQMVELLAGSPERVYQWTVESTDFGDIGAYLRMQDGRIKAGRGTYARRRPFVHFVFPSVEAAYAVLTASDSQMTGVRSGQVQTLGSPEYTRKISLLMQKVDELLQEG